MKKLIFYTISVIALISCQFIQKSPTKYFEGEVHYDVKYESLDSNISNESLAKELGEKQIWIFKEDKYLATINSKGWLGKEKQIYFLEKGIVYFDYEDSDTLFQVDTDKETGELLKLERNEEDRKTILGDDCESVSIEVKPVKNDEVERRMSGKIYFNPKYKLNPDKYAHQKLDYWNKVIGETKSILVGAEIINYPQYKTTIEATEIIEREVSEEEFELPQTKAIKVIK